MNQDVNATFKPGRTFGVREYLVDKDICGSVYYAMLADFHSYITCNIKTNTSIVGNISPTPLSLHVTFLTYCTHLLNLLTSFSLTVGK
jgi:hypothetical protein